MTLMSQQLQKAVILDSSYNIIEKTATDPCGGINTHELNFIENGTRVLVIRSRGENASKKDSAKIGFDGECRCQFD